jgi:hypothetical protein
LLSTWMKPLSRSSTAMRIDDAPEPFDAASSVALMLSVIERQFR